MDIKNYPKEYSCPCGRVASLRFKNISTYYNNQTFLVKSVPGYECENNHFKLARITRVKIKKLLKTAWEKNKKEIEFS